MFESFRSFSDYIRHTYVLPAEDKRTWRVQQMLVGP
jgi:hypothetical protein